MQSLQPHARNVCSACRSGKREDALPSSLPIQAEGRAASSGCKPDRRHRIRLSGPFGAGAYEINWMPGEITVYSRGTEAALVLGPDAAERFLAEQVGWSFPVTSVRYWLLGLADPAAPAAEQVDAGGRLRGAAAIRLGRAL